MVMSKKKTIESLVRSLKIIHSEMYRKLISLFNLRFPNLSAKLENRRITILSLVFSFSFIVFLSITLKENFRIVHSNLEVGLVETDEGIKLKSGHLIIHKRRDNDELTINAKFLKLSPEAEGQKIMLVVPKRLKLKKTMMLRGVTFAESWVRDDERRFTYTIKDYDNPSVWIKLGGPIFPKARELFFSLSIVTYSNDNYPIRVTIRGLDSSDINYLSPNPDTRNYWAIDYDPLEWESSATPMLKQIEFQMRDRENVYKNDYKIFIFAILLGIFASFFASIIWSLLREHEKNNINKT